MQIVEVEPGPGETVIAETGAVTYIYDNITFETKMIHGSEADEDVMSKLFGAGKRMIMGESIFITNCPNSRSVKSRPVFVASYRGDIIAIDVRQLGE